MGDLVYLYNDRPITDSRTVADVFHKNHKDVLRDIRVQISKLNKAEEDEFSRRNFALSDYKNDRGRTYQQYLLSEDGFTLVTMSYDTPEAMKIKVKYINEFNRMKEILRKQKFDIPKTLPEALRLAADKIEENNKLKKENKILKPKAKVHDQLVSSGNYVTMNEVAKNIGIGRNKLFEFLRTVGICFLDGGNNVPKQSYQNAGYFKVTVRPKQMGEYIKNVYTTRVSGKGSAYLLNLVNKYGGAKLLNSMKLDDLREYTESKHNEFKKQRKHGMIKIDNPDYSKKEVVVN